MIKYIKVVKKVTFGSRLAKLREKKNISRKELAKILGISYQTISKYETNKRNPDFNILIKLADFFDVTTDYLLGRPKKNIDKFKVKGFTFGCNSKEYKDLSRFFAKKIAHDTERNYKGIFDCFPSERFFDNSLLDRVYQLSEKSKNSLKEYLELLELRDAQEKEQNNTKSPKE